LKLDCDVEEDLLNISKLNYSSRLAELLPSARITSLAISESYVILGTNISDVLVFAQSEFKHCGTISNSKENGDVSSIAISNDERRLLIGFGKGRVLMYDLDTLKQLRKLPSDCHAIASSRVQLVSFISEQNIQGVCADSSSVTLLEFTKIITKRSTDVFQLVKGEMINPPRVFQSYDPASPLYRRPLMAVITPQKLIARPITKALEHPDYELSFPHLTRHHNALYTSWHLGSEGDPELILGHNQQITIFRFAKFSQWLVVRSIQLDEIVSFVSIVPQTSLKLVLASPDCTPPYKIYIYDDDSPTAIYNKTCEEIIALKPFGPYLTSGNILFQDNRGDILSVRMRDWNERIVKIKSQYSIKEAVKFVLSISDGQIKAGLQITVLMSIITRIIYFCEPKKGRYRTGRWVQGFSQYQICARQITPKTYSQRTNKLPKR
jgi:hypothetical protein